jgi:hypothetical protein
MSRSLTHLARLLLETVIDMTDKLFGSTKSTVALREKLIRCFGASEELIAAAVENFESQPERTPQSRLILSRQLYSVVDELLQYDDWSVSPYINQLLNPTRQKHAALKAFIEEHSGVVSKKVWQHPACPPGLTEAYILLYQSSGADMKGWESQVCDLHRMAVSRPLYGTQEAIENCMRHRGNQLTDGYALLHLPADYLQEPDGKHQDKYGQDLLQFRKTDLKPGFVKYFYYQDDVYELQEDLLVRMKQPKLNKGASDGG